MTARLPQLGRVSPADMQTCLYTDIIHAYLAVARMCTGDEWTRRNRRNVTIDGAEAFRRVSPTEMSL